MGDLQQNEAPNPTNVGGQAVIEGVMMRAPGTLSVVCRRADGRLVLRERSVPAPSSLWAKTPLLRGMYTLVSSIRIGHKALLFSAEQMEEDMEQEEALAQGTSKGKGANPVLPPSTWLCTHGSVASFLMNPVDPDGVDEHPASEEDGETQKEPGAEALDGAPIAERSASTEAPKVAAKAPSPKPHAAPAESEEPEEKDRSPLLTAIPILFAIGLFLFAPQLAAEGVSSLFGLKLELTSPGFQALTGIAKLIIVITYMSILRFTEAGRRMFQYHGAEHKAISTYEGSLPLDVAHARPVSALHARCGTTFIIMMAFVSVATFSVLGAFLPKFEGPAVLAFLVFFVMKLPLIPVVAGITFEIQRIFARYCTTGPLRILLWPGFLVQKITTAPPEDDQLEVALSSLRSALANANNALSEQHPDKSFDSYSKLMADPVYRAV